MLAPRAAPATLKRSITTPLRAALRHAYRQGWCDPPVFEIPRESKGRTNYLLPSQAARLVAAANPALRVLPEFILGTGARMSEALELDWRDVDLAGARAIFWVTKSGKRRNAHLPPRIVGLLANLPHREGAVIRRPDGQPYGVHPIVQYVPKLDARFPHAPMRHLALCPASPGGVCASRSARNHQTFDQGPHRAGSYWTLCRARRGELNNELELHWKGLVEGRSNHEPRR